MKAKDLVKKPVDINKIYEIIKMQNNNDNAFKAHLPHWWYIKEETIIQLINDGFKVYRGEWDGINTNALIIEW